MNSRNALISKWSSQRMKGRLFISKSSLPVISNSICFVTLPQLHVHVVRLWVLVDYFCKKKQHWFWTSFCQQAVLKSISWVRPLGIFSKVFCTTVLKLAQRFTFVWTLCQAGIWKYLSYVGSLPGVLCRQVYLSTFFHYWQFSVTQWTNTFTVKRYDQASTSLRLDMLESYRNIASCISPKHAKNSARPAAHVSQLGRATYRSSQNFRDMFQSVR